MFWSSSEFLLKIDCEDYHVYMGRNVSMVKQLHTDHLTSWFLSRLPWKTKTMKMNPFESTCIGILSRDEYTMRLDTRSVNYWHVGMSLLGIVLFYLAQRLCRNVFFHYTTGVGFGIFLSLIVITFFIQKRVSKTLF
jgi:hypothetical protein